LYFESKEKMEKILYRSTNRNSEKVSFKEAVLRGQAPDYGLYMPMSIPTISKEKINSFRDMNYSQIAFEIFSLFLGDVIEKTKLKDIVQDIYSFEIPIQKVKDKLYIMWLTKGPTASFKDFAARFMSKVMEYFAIQENRKLTILVATSGDTGGAVANAFYGLDKINVVILFPEQEITERQRKQMTTLGNNILPLAIKGKFDDCQSIVKRAFNDSDFKLLNLTSANSINFGRLLPQSVYYFFGYSRVDEEELVFSVPSGNFGNLLGGVIAKKMGLPIKRFIVGVNENDEFPKFLETGEYRAVVPSKECSSNAMNVGHPSNLARLVDIYGGWLTDVRDQQGNLIKQGDLKALPDMARLRNDFISYSVEEKEVDETILKFYNEYGILIEPHGAISIAASEKYSSKDVVISIETADPAKFPEKIQELLHIVPPISDNLLGLDDKEEEYLTIDSDYESFKENVLKILS
jgi:threonine synthase